MRVTYAIFSGANIALSKRILSGLFMSAHASQRGLANKVCADVAVVPASVASITTTPIVKRKQVDVINTYP